MMHRRIQAGDKMGVSIRRYPYPYRSILSICSDLDETHSLQSYIEIAEFLNTVNATGMGTGVGLEVGNTMYFDMAPGELSYWNVDDDGRKKIRSLIRSGHIDCFHSYGDRTTTRAQVVRVLDELAKFECEMGVWVDHAVAPTNFGEDIMCGKGDLETDAAFHADLTIAHGVQYVWRGRVTSIAGQNVGWHLGGILQGTEVIRSTVTLMKELVKAMLGLFPSSRYRMHSRNRLLQQVELRSGRTAFEFLRSNPHWRGVSVGDRGDRIGEVLTQRFLDTILKKEAVSILYTHLGKIAGEDSVLPRPTVDAFRMLADYRNSGKILVTTTRRLLDYTRLIDTVQWNCSNSNGQLHIDVEWDEAMYPADGLTFHVPDTKGVVLRLNGNVFSEPMRNGFDHTRRASIGIPWRPLVFPE